MIQPGHRRPHDLNEVVRMTCTECYRYQEGPVFQLWPEGAGWSGVLGEAPRCGWRCPHGCAKGWRCESPRPPMTIVRAVGMIAAARVAGTAHSGQLRMTRSEIVELCDAIEASGVSEVKDPVPMTVKRYRRGDSPGHFLGWTVIVDDTDDDTDDDTEAA